MIHRSEEGCLVNSVRQSFPAVAERRELSFQALNKLRLLCRGRGEPQRAAQLQTRSLTFLSPAPASAGGTLTNT
eukprot:241931-Prorocentrum_lima.AAC.1